MRTRHYLSL